MAAITLSLVEYQAAAKPFAAEDFITTDFSFADLTAAEMAALPGNNVDAIDARDDALQFNAAQ